MVALLTRCIRCGREARLVDGRLCVDCYLEVRGLGRLPEEVRLQQCTVCGSVRLFGEWAPLSLEDALRLAVQAGFKPNPEVAEWSVEGVEVVTDPYHGDKLVVRMRGRLSTGDVVEWTAATRLKLSKSVCPSCLRRAGGAFRAVVQVRGPSGLTPGMRLAVERLLERLPSSLAEAIVDIKEVKGGIDILLTDHESARAVAAKLRGELAAEVRESHKLWSRRRDGRRESILTISARLPEWWEPGSIVEADGRLMVVEDVRGGRVHLRPLGGGRAKPLPLHVAHRRLRVPKLDLTEAVVAALTPGWVHLQLLSGSYEYIEEPLGNAIVEGKLEPGARVLVGRWAGRLLVLPTRPPLPVQRR